MRQDLFLAPEVPASLVGAIEETLTEAEMDFGRPIGPLMGVILPGAVTCSQGTAEDTILHLRTLGYLPSCHIVAAFKEKSLMNRVTHVMLFYALGLSTYALLCVLEEEERAELLRQMSCKARSELLMVLWAAGYHPAQRR